MVEERLEEFKKEIDFLDDSQDMQDHGRFDDTCISMYDNDLFHWVYRYAKEQSERAQELGEDKTELYKLNQKLGAKAWGIEQQNKRYREAIERIKESPRKAHSGSDCVDVIFDIIKELESDEE